MSPYNTKSVTSLVGKEIQYAELQEWSADDGFNVLVIRFKDGSELSVAPVISPGPLDVKVMVPQPI